MPYHPKYCTILYTISCLLDALDGQAARALGQTSKFGSVLDMVTDRCVLSVSASLSTYFLSCNIHPYPAFRTYPEGQTADSDRHQGARLHVCYASYPRRTRTGQSFSSS